MALLRLVRARGRGWICVGARGADAGLEPIEEAGVVVVDGVDEAGNEDLGPGVGLGKEAMDEICSPMFFEVAGGKCERVEEGAVLFASCEQALAEQAIERGHDGGVSEAGVELFGDLLHRGAVEPAQDRKHFALAATEDPERRKRGTFLNWRFGSCHAVLYRT